MIEVEMLNHDLILQFGLLSSHYKNENDFVEKFILLISEIKKYNHVYIDNYIFRKSSRED